MLSLPSQLLLRSAEYLEHGNWALINPTEAGVFNALNNPNIVGLHQYHHYFSDCAKHATHRQHFAASFNKAEHTVDALDGVVIYLPKSKQQLQMLIANAACLVKANGVVLVVGENKAGIKSVSKLLSVIGENVNKIDSAKHCAVYAVTVTQPAKDFDIASYAVEREYIVNEQPIKVMSLPGVFGHKQLDPGTELLLKQFTSQSTQGMKGELYDFACGTGIIGCYLLKMVNKYHSRLKVTMTDVSALAIYCAEQSAKLNEVSATIEACDGFIQQYKRFDHIVSNPPFHDGIKNDYNITENFIKQAFGASNPYATMTVVANRFLPYPDIFEDVYKTFNEVAASNKYRVYSVTKPKK